MLRMGASASLDHFIESLSTRWQVPLLGVAIVLLIVAFSHVRPAEPAPTFQQQLNQIAALQQGGYVAEASEMIKKLLQVEDLPKDHRAVLLREMGETIYLAERANTRHDPENAKRIIRNHRRAMAAGLTASAGVHKQMGRAFQWLDDAEKAADQFRKAIAAGSENPGRLRRDLIGLLRKSRGDSGELVSEQVAHMLDEPGLDPNDLLWAVEQRVGMLSRDNKPDGVGELLEKVGPRLNSEGMGSHLEYLRARMHYLAGDYAQAERILFDLRGKLDHTSRLAIKVNWLLGRVHFRDGRPQVALGVFQELIRSQPFGEYYLAGRLGMAECLAALHHVDEAADVYEEVAGATARCAEGQVVDRDAVRASLTSLYVVLRAEGRLEAAGRFLRLATALVAPGDRETEAVYLRDLADLYVSLGEARLADAKPTARPIAVSTAPATQPTAFESAPAGAREAFEEAAETYLRLSEMTSMEPDRSAEAAWLAGANFDRANLPRRTVSVLEDFLLAHSASNWLPDVLFRLGQTLQAMGRYEQAMARYDENLRRFSRTPSAMRSLVPKAQCLMALGPKSYPSAEQALLMIVEQPAEKGRYDPQALEYREALFALADLYDCWDKSTRAISRLEEILERYPRDPRITRAQFVLANAYRKNGLDLLARKGAKTDQSATGIHQVGAARLDRAEELFSEVIYALQVKPFNLLGPSEKLFVKYSYLYRADCAFDLRQYDRALSLYEEVARQFRRDPTSLSAYVQILNCYQRLGKHVEARATLQQVKWMLKDTPAERFKDVPDGQTLAYWHGFLDWIEKSEVFER